MKKALFYFVCVLVISAWSCNKTDKCDGVDCFTPPEPFTFELVNKSTGENLFTSGELSPEDINIVNLVDQSKVEFQFIDENGFNFIQINTIGWETQTVNFSIEVSNESLFTLLVDAERKSGDCCTFTRYNNIEINGSEFDLNEQSGLYKILVE